MYNKTQLHPEHAFEKHVFHRDMFAHYLRWTHVLKRAKIGMKILDFGCGNGNLLEVLWRNRYKGKLYIGIDIRSKTIFNNSDKFKNVEWASFVCDDLVNPISNFGNDWDIITSFEVLEHIGKQNADKFLQNISNCANDNTIILLSTPNYDEDIGAASNHVIDGQVCEFTHSELQNLLVKYFTIEEKYGTFASIKDYYNELNDWQLEMYNTLSAYYDSNLLSVIMAPMFPEKSRNCLWVLKKK
ncbi:hypothetical protein LCGC14_2461040 [marine sediment metagenome]|uniref:Methyltransferase domain-containing protein n=1 Tax=marine sediment metagenome TaxID=412755 RepID=A0A0F9DQE0_9ZZZZ